MPDETIKSSTIIQQLCEYFRTADQHGFLPIFSANLVAVPSLCAVKSINVKSTFSHHPSKSNNASA